MWVLTSVIVLWVIRIVVVAVGLPKGWDHTAGSARQGRVALTVFYISMKRPRLVVKSRDVVYDVVV